MQCHFWGYCHKFQNYYHATSICYIRKLTLKNVTQKMTLKGMFSVVEIRNHSRSFIMIKEIQKYLSFDWCSLYCNWVPVEVIFHNLQIWKLSSRTKNVSINANSKRKNSLAVKQALAPTKFGSCWYYVNVNWQLFSSGTQLLWSFTFWNETQVWLSQKYTKFK